jgi:phosphatidylglycerophosphate synthase
VDDFTRREGLTMFGWLRSLSADATGLGYKIVALMRKIRRPLTFAVCRFFIHLHINQSHVTMSRLFLFIGFYFAWINSAFSIALGLMLTAWILDCIDGDLSRMLKNDNTVGEFEDVFVDNLAFLVFPLALIQSGRLSGVLGALFVFSAFSVLWMAERKQTGSGESASLLFHPKGDLFLSLSRKAVWVLMYLLVLFRFDLIKPTYVVITAILSISVLVNYFEIVRSRLKLG